MAKKGYEALETAWSEVLDLLAEGLEEIDVDKVKKLIFDTYHFYRQEIGEDGKVDRKIMTVYKYAGQIGYYFTTNLVEGIPESVSTTCADFLQGLCYVIEDTFDAGYGDNPLPIGLGRHTPAGGAYLEADMTTYETFEKAFDEQVASLQEEYGME